MIKPQVDNTPIVELVANLKEMRAELERIQKTSPMDSKKIEEINKDIEETNRLLQSQAEIYDASGKSIIELRKDVKAFQSAIAEAEGDQQMIAFAQAAGKAKDQMNDLNERVAVFAGGTQFEQASTALGQISGDLANLDFGGAAEKAKGLNTIVKGISFKGASAGLKDLGSTFMTLGKSLLTNPLFLIAAVIAGIIYVIYKLLDAVGVVKVMMKIWGDVMKVIGKIIDDFIIQPLKDLTDWMGITANAAEDSAQRQADAAQMVADRQKGVSGDTIQALDNEIRMRKLNGENTRALERQKLVEIAATGKAQAAADRAAFKSAKLKGELTKEEIKALKDKATASRKAYGQMINDIKFFDAETTVLAEDKAKKDAEDAAARAKKAADTRIEVERKVKDIELSLLEEGYDKERALLQEKYRRELQDVTRNENYNATQKALLKTALEKKFNADQEKINQEEWEKRMEVDSKLQIVSAIKALEGLKTQRNAELQANFDANVKQFEDNKAFREAELAAEQTLRDAKFDLANSLVDALSQLAGENKAVAEVAFLASKGLAIAQIVTNTLAEISGIASNPALTALPDLGVSVKGPAILAAKVRAGAQIATIAATTVGKYMNGGKPSIPGAAPSGRGSTPSSTPNFQLFGQANQGNTVNATPQANQQMTQQMTVKAVVVESDVTSTIARVTRYRNLSEL